MSHEFHDMNTAPAQVRDVRSEPLDDSEVMRIWRAVGLPEYFLGNGGTNAGLVAFANALKHEGLVKGLATALEIAASHAGDAEKARSRHQGMMKFASDEARTEIYSEERGEKIASEIISRKIQDKMRELRS